MVGADEPAIYKGSILSFPIVLFWSICPTHQKKTHRTLRNNCWALVSFINNDL